MKTLREIVLCTAVVGCNAEHKDDTLIWKRTAVWVSCNQVECVVQTAGMTSNRSIFHA